MSEREVNEETLTFLLDYLGGTLEEQELHVEAIATRAGQLFAAGTVLLGLTAAASSELNSLLVGASVGAYLAATVFAFFTMRRPRMRVSRQADELWGSSAIKRPRPRGTQSCTTSAAATPRTATRWKPCDAAASGCSH